MKIDTYSNLEALMEADLDDRMAERGVRQPDTWRTIGEVLEKVLASMPGSGNPAISKSGKPA